MNYYMGSDKHDWVDASENDRTEKQLRRAKRLLKEAAGYLCANDPEQGDYCRCGAYGGAGWKHNSGCLYVRLQKFLKKGI